MRQDIIHRMVRITACVLFRVIFSLFTHQHVQGKENVPEHGPVVVVANHLSYADQYLLTIAIKREMIFMAKEDLFRNRVMRFLIEAFGAIPVRRGAMNWGALKQVHQVLDDGLAMFMFPEGSRSKNAQLQSAFPGSALIALHNDAPVLPVGISGIEVAEKGFLWVMFHRPRVAVNIGHPFYLHTPGGRLDKKQLKDLSDDIMEHIAELLPPEYRGYYANRQRD